MAFPYLDKEEKKRLQDKQSLARVLQTPINMANTEYQFGKQAYDTVTGGINSAVRAIEAYGPGHKDLPEGIYPQDRVEPLDSGYAYKQQYNRQLELNADVTRQALHGAVDPYRKDPGKVGLTRIVKTRNADGTNSYSSVSDGSGGGEVRYYDQAGVRAGQIGDKYNNETLQPLGGYRDLQNDDGAFADAMRQGATSMKWVDRVNGETAKARAKAELEAMPPEQRVSLLNAQGKERGENARFGAGLQRDERRLQFDAQKETNANDRFLTSYERDKANDAIKNPSGAFMRFNAENANLPPEDFAKMLASPTNKDAAAARDALQKVLQAQGYDGTPGSLVRNSKLLQLLGRKEYRDGSAGIGGGRWFGKDIGLPPEITDDRMRAYIEADLQVRQGK